MNFYLKTIHVGQWSRNNIFGKKNYQYQLLSIALLCENGNPFYAISKNFDRSAIDRETLDNVMPSLPIHTNSLWKSVEDIAHDLRTFVEYNAGRADIRFVGMDSAIDFTLLTGIYGGLKSSSYPKTFPTQCIDLQQTIEDAIEGMPDVFFVENEKASYMPPNKEYLSIEDKINVVQSYDGYPQVGDVKYMANGMVLHIGEVHKFIKAFKASLTHKTEENNEIINNQ